MKTIDRETVVRSIRDVWGDLSDVVFDMDGLRSVVINGVTYTIVDDAIPDNGGNINVQS